MRFLPLLAAAAVAAALIPAGGRTASAQAGPAPSGAKTVNENARWMMVEAAETMRKPGGGEQMVALCRRARQCGYNGLLLWDSNLWDRQLPATYLKNAAALKEGLIELRFTLMVEMCPRGVSLARWSGDESILEPRPRDPHPDERDYRYFCMSHPGVVHVWEEQLQRAEEIYHPLGWLLQYDELRVAGTDARCRASGKTPGQLLKENALAAIAMVRRVAPGSVVSVWNDMFDPHHNATAQKYYHVIGTLEGSWEAIDRNVLIMDFNDKIESFEYWSKRGNTQMVSGYFDNELGLQKEGDLIKRARHYPGVVGWMYTTWEGNFKDLESYGAMCGFGDGASGDHPAR